jgi:hypothetical protein
MPEPDQIEADVQVLREQLAQLEQERADLRLELDEFAAVYEQRVGALEADLLAARLHVEEYKLRIELIQLRGRRLGPSQLEAEVEYRLHDQRDQSAEKRRRVEQARSAAPAPALDRAAQLDLKQLYRELAKRTHPDLATDEADRRQRSQSMVMVNEAYAQRDTATLRKLLQRLDAGHATLAEDPAQREARLRLEYARLRDAILHAKIDLAEMNQGPMMKLKLERAVAQGRGRDVFQEVEQQLSTQLMVAQSELQQLIAKFREVVEAAGLAD